MRLATQGSINDQVYFLALDQIDHIGPAFPDFEDVIRLYPVGLQKLASPGSGQKVKSEILDILSNRDQAQFIPIIDAEENRSIAAANERRPTVGLWQKRCRNYPPLP